MFLGCDTSSKVGTKSSAFKSATNKSIPALVSFGQASFDEDMKVMAENFLVGCVSKDENIDDFDNLRNKTYYKKSTEINIEKLPPTSPSIALHIKRAYLQTYIWLHVPFMNNLEIDPLQYGNDFDEDDDVDEIVPTIVDHVLPEDFPMPCKCGKCARENICLCRMPNQRIKMLSILQLSARIMQKSYYIIKNISFYDINSF